MSIYLIGSLRNSKIPQISKRLRKEKYDVFDDWFAAGPEADDWWQKYETERGRNYAEALDGYAAKHVYNFDLEHIKRCDVGILILPAGKSGHLELGYMIGAGKKGYILFDEEMPERWDVMYQFAEKVFYTLDDLIVHLDENHKKLKVK